MEYLDFEVEIERLSGQDYRVAARSPAGEARAEMRFPFDELALRDLHKDLRIALLSSAGLYRQVLSPEEQTVRTFGQQVFDGMITGEIRDTYQQSLQMAVRQGKGLRMKLCILAPELAALPWEYLFDQRQGKYLCLSLQTPLVRTLALPHPMEPLRIVPPLRILGMIASPSDQARLDIAREQRRIREALQDLEERKLVELHWLEGQTWHDLNRAMRGGPWHIFHFIGHGGFDPRADQGVLALVGDEGRSHLLTAEQMGMLLENHKPLRLVVLNACEGSRGSQHDLFSSTAARLALQGIPAVLAMQYSISDRAAIECTRAFYEGLAEGVPIDEAVTEARRAIHLELQHSLEWGTPLLYLRSPDGQLFDLHTQPPVSGTVTARKQDSADPFPAPTKQPMPERSTLQQPAAPKLVRGATLFTLSSHTDRVWSVAWSPDGARLASASADRTVRLWDGTAGQPLAILSGHTGIVWSVAWSPDGMRLASASDDQTVRLWDGTAGQPLATLSGHTREVWSVAWSPDGTRLASASLDLTVRLWDAVGRKHPVTLSGHTNFVRAVAWSPNGTRLASAGGDQVVGLWDTVRGKLLTALSGHTKVVLAVAWSPDGMRLASASTDRTVRVWDASSGQPLATLKGHTRSVLAVAWSPDGMRLATAGADRIVRLWDAASGQPLTTLSGHTDEVWAVPWSPDGTRLASASADRTVRVWYVGEG